MWYGNNLADESLKVIKEKWWSVGFLSHSVPGKEIFEAQDASAWWHPRKRDVIGFLWLYLLHRSPELGFCLHYLQLFFFFQIWGLKFFLQSLVFLCLSNLWSRCLKVLIQAQDSVEYPVHEPEGKASGQAKERRDGTWFRLTCMLGSRVFWKCIKFFPKRKFPF